MVATRTQSTLTATITQSSLIAAIKTAFTSAGLSATPAEFTDGSSNKFLVYTVTYNVATYGTVYLWIQVTTALAVSCRLAADFNSGTNTSTNTTTYSTAVTFSTSADIALGAINAGGEASLVYLNQSTNFVVLGILRPSVKPTAWNENNYPFAFHPTNNAMATFTSFAAALSPYTSAGYAIPTITQLASPATYTGQSDVLTDLLLLTSANQGIAGKFSVDFGQAAATGLSRLNLILISSSKYLVLALTPGAATFCINVDN